MAEDEEMILTLRHPCRLYLGPMLNDPMRIDGKRVSQGFPNFALLPELLADKERKRLLGVAFLIPPGFQRDVETWSRSLDQRYVRFGRSSATSQVPPESDSNGLLHRKYLEVRWSEDVPDVMIIASLTEAQWVYTVHQDGPLSYPSVVDVSFDDIHGVSICCLNSILQDHGLAITPSPQIQPLQVSSI